MSNLSNISSSSIGAAQRSVSSRIETDIELVKMLTARIESSTSRIINHARSLGYYEPPSDKVATAPEPVITTLADALRALDRAVDHNSGSLNVFD